MFWIFIVLFGSSLFALSNIFDTYFTNRLFKDTPTLIFYSSVFNLIFVPLIFFFQTPSLPTWSELPFFLLLGLTDIGYRYPYYKALQNDDTSIVVSLFSLGKIFVPLLAFLIVDERLQLTQYFGFLIIVLCSALLTWNGGKTLRFNRSFLYMSLASLILSLEVVIFKYIFASASWSTGLTWSLVFSFLFSLPLLSSSRLRRNIIDQVHRFKTNSHFFFLEELATFGGFALYTYVLTFIPVTLMEGVASFQPFFVLLYALLFTTLFPHAFKEKITARDIIKKGLLFIVMVLGVFLSVQ
ncbi:EamA family transporter [Candidatus Woesearchaeota archaeon]|nr:EamA family transporter [Candidatus Woesearchaeota archaeon]